VVSKLIDFQNESKLTFMKQLLLLLIIIPKLVFSLPACPEEPGIVWDDCIKQALVDGGRQYE